MEWLGMLRRYNPLHDKYGYLGLIGIGVAAVVLGLIVRSDVAANLLEALLELIGWVGIVGGAAIAIAGAVAYANERGWLNLPEESGGGTSAAGVASVGTPGEPGGVTSTPAEADVGASGESDGGTGAVDAAGVGPPGESGGAGAVDEAPAAAPRQAGSRPNRGVVRGFLTAGLFLIVLVTFPMTWVQLEAGRAEVHHSGLETLTNEDIREDEDYSFVVGSIYITAIIALIGVVLSPLIRVRILGPGIRLFAAALGLFFLIGVAFGVYDYVAEEIGTTDFERYGVEIGFGAGYWLSWVAFLAVAAVQFIPIPFTRK